VAGVRGQELGTRNYISELSPAAFRPIAPSHRTATPAKRAHYLLANIVGKLQGPINRSYFLLGETSWHQIAEVVINASC